MPAPANAVRRRRTTPTTISRSTPATRGPGEFIPVRMTSPEGRRGERAADGSRELVEREQRLPVRPRRGHGLRPGQPARRLLHRYRHNAAQGGSRYGPPVPRRRRRAVRTSTPTVESSRWSSTRTIRPSSTRSRSSLRDVLRAAPLPPTRPRSSTCSIRASASEPDNLAVGHTSLMVQEDASNAKIWRFDLDIDLDPCRHRDAPEPRHRRESPAGSST